MNTITNKIQWFAVAALAVLIAVAVIPATSQAMDEEGAPAISEDVGGYTTNWDWNAASTTGYDWNNSVVTTAGWDAAGTSNFSWPTASTTSWDWNAPTATDFDWNNSVVTTAGWDAANTSTFDWGASNTTNWDWNNASTTGFNWDNSVVTTAGWDAANTSTFDWGASNTTNWDWNAPTATGFDWNNSVVTTAGWDANNTTAFATCGAGQTQNADGTCSSTTNWDWNNASTTGFNWNNSVVTTADWNTNATTAYNWNTNATTNYDWNTSATTSACADGSTRNADGSCGSATGRWYDVAQLERDQQQTGRWYDVAQLERNNQTAAAQSYSQPRYQQPAPAPVRYASARPAGYAPIAMPRYYGGGQTASAAQGYSSYAPAAPVRYASAPSYPSYPPQPPVYPPQPPVYPPQPPVQPPISQGVRCDAFYFTNQYGQRTETAYRGDAITLIWQTTGGQAQGIIGLGQVQASGSRPFNTNSTNTFRVGTHQLTLRVIGQGTGNQTDCTAVITISERPTPVPPVVQPPVVYPQYPIVHYPQMPVYPYQQYVVQQQPIVFPQTTYSYALRAPSPVVCSNGTEPVRDTYGNATSCRTIAAAPVQYMASAIQSVQYVQQPAQPTLCADGTAPVRSATTGTLTCYTQAQCPAGSYPKGERNGALVCEIPAPAPAPVVSVVERPVVVEKPVYQIVEKPVYVQKDVIVEHQVKPIIKVAAKIVDPVEKVTLTQVPETGAEDYFMPLFYAAIALTAAYVVKSKAFMLG